MMLDGYNAKQQLSRLLVIRLTAGLGQGSIICATSARSAEYDCYATLHCYATLLHCYATATRYGKINCEAKVDGPS
jgi:hypothetical protein